MKGIACKVVMFNSGVDSSFITEQDKTRVHKEWVIMSPCLLHWNLSNFVYHHEFDLGIGDEWLPKHPVESMY